MTPLILKRFTAVSAIGRGLAQTVDALENMRGGLAPCAFETVDLETYVGEVSGLDATKLPQALLRFNCRNNRLAQLGLAQDGFTEAVAESAARWGSHRVGVFLGTSTAGMLETELAYRDRDRITRRLTSGFQLRQHSQLLRGRRFRPAHAAIARARRCRMHGMFLKRESVCIRAAHDQRRHH